MAPTPEQQRAAKAKVLSGNAKPPKARIQRYLQSVQSQYREGSKKTLLLKGIRCSQAMGSMLKDMRAMQAPHCKLLTKKNAIVPFGEDSVNNNGGTGGQHSLEFLSTKNDCAMFALASTNKKRPNNLVLGRTFDYQLLDMVEFGILRYKSIQDYGGSVPKKRLGSKPMLLFLGDLWQQDSTCQKLQNLLVDFYRGDVVDKLVVSGLDHVITFVASYHKNNNNNNTIGNSNNNNGQLVIHQHTYFCKLKKDPYNPTTNIPVPYLTPCGPDLTMILRRTQFASPDLWKAALQQPQGLKKKKTASSSKKKNQSSNMFGETIGRLHIKQQDVTKMGGRKAKAIRRAEKAQAEEELNALEGELEREKQIMNQEFKQVYGFDKND